MPVPYRLRRIAGRLELATSGRGGGHPAVREGLGLRNDLLSLRGRCARETLHDLLRQWSLGGRVRLCGAGKRLNRAAPEVERGQEKMTDPFQYYGIKETTV